MNFLNFDIKWLMSKIIIYFFKKYSEINSNVTFEKLSKILLKNVGKENNSLENGNIF